MALFGCMIVFGGRAAQLITIGTLFVSLRDWYVYDVFGGPFRSDLTFWIK